MHKELLTRAVPLLLLTMLAGCASPNPATNLGTLTASGKPAVCLSLEIIHPSRGKPQALGAITTEDVEALLDKDHPIERLRNLVGDTTPTLTQIDKNNAALASLCGGTNGPPD